MYSNQHRLSKEVSADVQEYFGEKLYKTKIVRNTKLSEAPSSGKPIQLYDIKSPGSENYLQLAEEIIHVNGQKE